MSEPNQQDVEQALGFNLLEAQWKTLLRWRNQEKACPGSGIEPLAYRDAWALCVGCGIEIGTTREGVVRRHPRGKRQQSREVSK